MKTTYQTLIPDGVRRAGMILLTAILPQLLLLWMNIHSFQLISGEMSNKELHNAFLVFVGELTLLGGTIGLCAFLLKTRRLIHVWASLALLAMPSAFLVLMLWKTSQGLLPNSVTVWILPAEQFMYYHFALLMPGIFHATATLAGFPHRVHDHRDGALTLSALIGIPLAWLGFIHLPYSMRIFDWPEWLEFVLAMASIILATLALVRFLLSMTDERLLSIRAIRLLLAGLFGVVAPVGGLVLNWHIPFPADFQSPTIYALALINGALLMLDGGASLALNRLLALGRALLFPFTLYFFMVFLPFLPLSIPALLFFGAGVLMLTPTVLFILHTRLLAADFRLFCNHTSRKRAALWLGAAMAVIPLLLAGQALLDRTTLRTALRYVYHSNPQEDRAFEGNRLLLRHSLLQLRDFKEGLHLPFLSAFYNQVVFNGLILPDEKMHELHQAFFGTPVPPSRNQGKWIGYVSDRSRLFTSRPMNAPLPAHGVLTGLQVTHDEEDSCRRVQAQLDLHNPTAGQTEYTTTITVPDGVQISGFWLHIGAERVPGRIFEKKTALWVYRMIRDATRRDPGLLYYQDKNHLELRVFPLAPNETRHVEVEFLYPETLAPGILLNGQPLHEPPPAAPGGIARADSPAGTQLVLSQERLSQLPSVVRRPYLHFIVDRSESGALAQEQALELSQALASQFPEIPDCAVTFANYEVQDASEELIPVSQLNTIVARPSLPARGGFCRDRAIRHALGAYACRLACAGEEGEFFLRYPVPVILTSGNSEPAASGGLAGLMGLAPDAGRFYTASGARRLESQNAAGLREETSTLRARPVRVVLLELGGEVIACPAENPSSTALLFLRGTGDTIRVYHPETGIFQPLEDVLSLPPDSRYARGAEAWLIHAEGERDASKAFQMQALLAGKSRESGILTPATSYIVVENSAQWNMLERTEKKKLKNFESLEIAAAPEPSTWALLALAGGLLAWRAAWRKPRNNQVERARPTKQQDL